MASNMDRNISEATGVEIQASGSPGNDRTSSGSLGNDRTSQQQQVFPNEGGFVESSDFGMVNGLPDLTPVSTIQQETKLQIEQPESSRAQSRKRRLPEWTGLDGVVESQQRASNGGPSTENMPVPAVRETVTKDLFFRLFARATDVHILEQHEVQTGKVKRYRCTVYEDNGKWKLKKSHAEAEQHDLNPMTEDILPLRFQRKYNLSLQDRLDAWTLKVKPRTTGSIKDKFYRHMGRQFRSIVEVGAYIIYSSKREHLIPLRAERSNEVLEAEAAEAMLIMSSAQADMADDHSSSPPPVINAAPEGHPNDEQNPRGDLLMTVEVANPQEPEVTLDNPPAMEDGAPPELEDILVNPPAIEDGAHPALEKVLNNLPAVEDGASENGDGIFANLQDIENLDF